MKLLNILGYGFLAIAVSACSVQTNELASPKTIDKRQAIKVEIIGEPGNYQLLRGGEPYQIHGAGVDHTKLETVVAHGGNSIRTWAVDSGPEPAQQLLDRAHALGITVTLCLEFARERHGFDYNDEEAVARQFADTKAKVLKYKDHPALLAWMIGNELNYDFTNPEVYDAVNDVSKMIHAIDPNHPTTTAIAGFGLDTLEAIEQRAPDIDFVSIQMYGDLMNLPKYKNKINYQKPYFVTEWGAVGHWEVWKTAWGAPVEQTSSEKANNYMKSYQHVLEPYSHSAIGNYVFLWGQKQEKTPTWYGLYLDTGEETEAIDVMHYIWNGKWPDNRTPQVSRITLNNQTAYDNVYLKKNHSYKATLEVVEPDNESVQYKWEIRPESTSTKVGGDHEKVPPVISGLIENPASSEAVINIPDITGAYRLFVYVYDGYNNAAHANIPFYIK
jgi:hypothetical protein